MKCVPPTLLLLLERLEVRYKGWLAHLQGFVRMVSVLFGLMRAVVSNFEKKIDFVHSVSIKTFHSDVRYYLAALSAFQIDQYFCYLIFHPYRNESANTNRR